MGLNKEYVHKWAPVLGCFLVFFYSWGPILSFGFFQTYYKEFFLSGYSESTISWLGTLSAFFLMAIGPLTGPIYDSGYFPWLLGIGSFLVVFGMMMLSLATKYYQILLTQSILIGVGAGMLWTPCLSYIAGRFAAEPKVRTIALGLTTSGSSIGGVIFPIALRNLQPSVGFGWAIRICGFITLGVAIVALAILLQYRPPKPPFVRQLIDTSAFVDFDFMLLVVSGLFSMIGYFAVLVYLPTYTATHLTDSYPAGLPFYILSLVNGASTFSRIGAGFVAGWIGPLQAYCIALVFLAILAFCWIAVHTVAGLVVWTIFWGMASGLIVSLPSAVTPYFTPKPMLIGTRMGLAMFPCGVGMLVGSPIGGAIIGDDGTPEWWPLQILVGLTMIVTWLLCIGPLIRLMKRQKLAKAKAQAEKLAQEEKKMGAESQSGKDSEVQIESVET